MYEVHVPNSLKQYGFTSKEIQRRFVEWLILSLFTEGRISSGKAAKLLDISRIEFLDLLKARGIAFINYAPEELDEEIKSAKAVKTKKAK
ncbi:MAG: UPF0175 family protein [Anaerolineales bacterium]|nr:UPF0175 family protein [Anaerolineales bacterium]